MKIQVAPSILSADFAALGDGIRMIEAAGADLVHVDVMDGHFVPNISFGIPVVKCARKATKMPFDVHLMIENPDKYIEAFADAGADIIAFDGTQRKRPNGANLEGIIKYIKINKRVSMADISTVEEGIKAAEMGADMLSTTLSGYTLESPLKEDGPDFELLKELVEKTDVPVVLEGRIWHPHEVDKAFELGAHCVVIGSAITRPQLITKRFVARKK